MHLTCTYTLAKHARSKAGDKARTHTQINPYTTCTHTGGELIHTQTKMPLLFYTRFKYTNGCTNTHYVTMSAAAPAERGWEGRA